MDGKPWELMVCVVLTSPCSDVKGFVLSLLPELGTMGSKWGGVEVTRSSTSYEGCALSLDRQGYISITFRVKAQ